VRCAAITRAKERCKAEATHGSYCWNHAPETAEARKQRARKAVARGATVAHRVFRRQPRPSVGFAISSPKRLQVM
jgi:hypothetical protein